MSHSPKPELEIVSVRFGHSKSITRLSLFKEGIYEATYEDWFYDDNSYHPLLWLKSGNRHLAVE